jgi:hypothetical protein
LDIVRFARIALAGRGRFGDVTALGSIRAA